MMSIINKILGIPTTFAQVTSSASQVANDTGDEFGKLFGNFLAQIPLWIAAIVVALLSYVLAIIVRKAIEKKLAQEGVDEEHQEVRIVAGRGSFFAVLTIGVTTALSIVGIDLAPIVAAGAFGLGFALQDIIMNSISGMLILASRHYTIGDVIKVGGVVGRIVDIQTRATIIRAFDGTMVIVPNAHLFKNVVISKTSNPYRKLTFIMGVDYSADLKQAMELSLAVVKTVPWVLKKPRPRVIFYEWGDYSINFRINVWIDSKGGKLIKVKNAVMIALSKAYNESGINIPYPIQTIQLDKADEEEFTKEEIDKKIAEIKTKLAPKSKQTDIQILSPTASQATPEKKLPTAIDTTPNSPGQNWLQEALVKQTQPESTTPASPVQQPVVSEPVPQAQNKQPAVQPQPATTQSEAPTSQTATEANNQPPNTAPIQAAPSTPPQQTNPAEGLPPAANA